MRARRPAAGWLAGWRGQRARSVGRRGRGRRGGRPGRSRNEVREGESRARSGAKEASGGGRCCRRVLQRATREPQRRFGQEEELEPSTTSRGVMHPQDLIRFLVLVGASWARTAAKRGPPTTAPHEACLAWGGHPSTGRASARPCRRAYLGRHPGGHPEGNGLTAGGPGGCWRCWRCWRLLAGLVWS